jgi:protease-4
VALAYLTGTIGNGDDDSGTGANAGPFIKAMHRFADDADVRAVVLRIDSPGGSALASDRMWHAVRRVAKRKPVIVSIGDMAASGGYYVACAGTEILAQDTSLVGSIGVVGGKIVIEDLSKRVGLHMVDLSRGKNSGWMSSAHAFTDSERASLQGAMEETYRTFVARVSEGRHLSAEQLAPVVEGRIMSGERARKGGLVDTAGGLTLALEHARSKGGVDKEAAVEIWPKQRSFFERLAGAFSGSDARAGAFDQASGVLRALHLPASTGLVEALVRGDSVLTALPYSLDLR